MSYYALVRDAGNAVRLAEVLQILVKKGFADLLSRIGVYHGAPAKMLRRLHLVHEPIQEPATQAQRLREALAELGPTFVKVGQILSTRPDIVGVKLSQELQNLQDRVPAVSFDLVKPMMEEALGAPLDYLFRQFDPIPFAAASLSQVHRALLPTGELVAVKVQRPGVARVIDSDMKLLRGIAKWIESHVEEFRWINPVGLVEEFHRSILRELNFATEAKIMQQFQRNFAENEFVFIPRIYVEQSCELVLTMDFVDGVRIDDVDQYAARDSFPPEVAKLGCESVCAQIFGHRLFHADPHPGNIFLTRHNQIAFLDFGMAGALEEDDVHLIAEAFRGVFDQNTSECVRTFLRCTVTGEADDPAALEREISEFVRFEAGGIVSQGLVSKAIEKLIAILHRHHLQLAPRFSLLLKALITIESTGHRLDPELDMVPIIRPHVERIMQSRFAPGHLFEEFRHDVVGLLRVGRQMPQEVSQVVRMLRRGTFKLQVSHEKLSNLATILDRASNRLTFGIITGALIVGSSMLVTSDSRAQQLGVAGYTIAGLLGLALLVSILRSKNL